MGIEYGSWLGIAGRPDPDAVVDTPWTTESHDVFWPSVADPRIVMYVYFGRRMLAVRHLDARERIVKQYWWTYLKSPRGVVPTGSPMMLTDVILDEYADDLLPWPIATSRWIRWTPEGTWSAVEKTGTLTYRSWSGTLDKKARAALQSTVPAVEDYEAFLRTEPGLTPGYLPWSA